MTEPRRPQVPDGALTRRTVLGGLLATAGALAGCASLPTSGPVEAHSPLAGDGLPPRPVPPPPLPGAGPRVIVQGFLRASAVGSVEAAWAYLAGVEVDWDAEARVLLHRQTARVTVLSGPGAAADAPPSRGPSPSTSASTGPPRDGATAEVVVGIDLIATLDRDGRLTLLDEAEHRTRRFDLVAEAGEWRISALDDGVLLDLGQFVASTYRSTPVYFPDRTGNWLVPDVRYIRQDTPSTQTQVVTALLDGPSTWLASALSLPDERPHLTLSSVPVKGGVATVDLTQEALALDERRHALLQAQLERSLAATEGSPVLRVELVVNGEPLRGGPSSEQPAGSGAQPLPTTADQATAGDEYVAVEAGSKARVVTVLGGQIRTVAGLELTGGVRPAMSYQEQRTFALVVPGRRTRTLKVARPDGPVVSVASWPDLTPPSFDVFGWVWTSPRRAAGTVAAGRLSPDGSVRRVSVGAPWLDSGQVVALRLSREGARAIVLVDTVRADGRHASRLLLCGVERTESGRPVALSGPVRLFPDLERGCDVAWSGASTVVVLGARAGEAKTVAVQPWVVDVGGDVSSRGVAGTAPLGQIVVDAEGRAVSTAARWARMEIDVAPSLAVGDGLDSLYVSTWRGDLFRYRLTGSWEGIRPSVLRPAFPG